MRSPVFIVGAPRSGTTLLYHILVSSGEFADYRAESRAYDLIGPAFGSLRTWRARQTFLDRWIPSYQFERSGLDEGWIRNEITTKCRGTGEFLRILMEGIARDQAVDRWAECTPQHAIHLDQIAKDFPDAKILHVIRDGRDVALSLARQGWIRPLRLDRGREEVVAALYWEWICRKGRLHGQSLEDQYLEVRFENLVERPESVLDPIGSFIGQRLDWAYIKHHGIGTVRRPNSSFDDRASNPVERWRQVPLSTQKSIERHIGPMLRELGYTGTRMDVVPPGAALRRGLYRTLFDSKHYLKTRTPLGRIFAGTENLDRADSSR